MTYISIPAAPVVWAGTMSFGDVAAGNFLNIVESSDPNAIASAAGNAITVTKPGTYTIHAMAHTGSQVFSDGQTWRLEIWASGVNQGTRFTSQTTPVNGNQGSGNSRCWASAIVTLAAGATIQIRGITTSAGAWSVTVPDGNVELIFTPTTAYPKPV